MYKTITEGSCKVKVPKEAKISAKLPVFFNPVMKFNRDTSILLLKASGMTEGRAALPLTGTGVRGIRFLAELKSKIGKVFFNDMNPEACKLVKENLKLNGIKDNFVITNLEADEFFSQSEGFEYIDIDPFGSPNRFLDGAIKRIGRKGLLAVTATDTSALCGTYTKVCRRRYWAEPKKDFMMHETGLRILIRKVQLLATQYEKALTPIFSYSKDHYMRVIFICEKGKKKCDEVMKQHGMFNDAGPLWLGRLWDPKLMKKMKKLSSEIDDFDSEFFDVLVEESQIETVGFFDLDQLAKQYKISNLPKMDKVLASANERFKAARTHFDLKGIRSDIDEKSLVKILKS